MKTLVSAAAVAAIAGSAFGLGETLDRSNYARINATTMIEVGSETRSGGPIYGYGASVYGWDDSTATGTIVGTGLVAFPLATGLLGVEDYGMETPAPGSTPPNGTPGLHPTTTLVAYECILVLPAAPSGGVIAFAFDWFQNDFTPAYGFVGSIGLPAAFAGGTFFISFTAGGAPFGAMPTEGYHTITADDGSLGGDFAFSSRWPMSTFGAAPSYGHNDLAWDNGTGPGGGNVGHLFAMAVPTPGAMGLLGLGGLVAIRRRR
jgi:MYXO-CTERM domain-containing protein